MAIILHQFIFCKGFCPAEMSEGVSWPQTYFHSESVTVTVHCPEDNDRNMTRECRNGVWRKADKEMCLSFKEIVNLVMEENMFTKMIDKLLNPYTADYY